MEKTKEYNMATHRRQSMIFQGNSIFQKLATSSFGAFQRAMTELSGLTMEDFFVPEVVVIGAESSGKSSLLEAITKCAVFPRGKTFTTRMPVRLLLTTCQEGDTKVSVLFKGVEHKGHATDDILGLVDDIMNDLPDDEITDAELTIRIHEPNIPTFSFIDLPGIRAFPPAMAARSKQLVSSYLARPNILVMCVVPAPTQRLTTVDAIAMVLALNKAAETVVALTMTDKVNEENMAELVLDRLSGSSTELQGTGLAACVATVNRTHDDGWTLAEVDELEGHWFANTFSSRKEMYSRLQKQMTQAGVVRLLDEFYHKYICRAWRPRALIKITAMQTTTRQHLEQLGPADVSADELRAVLRNELDGVWPVLLPHDIFGDHLLPELDDVGPILSPHTGRDRKWAEAVSLLQDVFGAWLRNIDLTTFLRDKCQGLLGASFTNASELKTERFAQARALVLSHGEDVRHKHADKLHRILKLVSYGLSHPRDDVLESWKDEVIHAIQITLILPVLKSVETVALVSPLSESETCRAERAQVQKTLANLQTAETIIVNIDSALHHETLP